MIVFYFYGECAVGIALALAVLIIIGIFKRGFLSRPVVYHITVLFSIFLMNNSAFVINDSNVEWYVTVSYFINILSLIIYIRGHIFPINKNLDKYRGDPKLYAAKRLIFTGFLGVCLYTLLAVCVYCYALYYGSQQSNENHEKWALLYIYAKFFMCLVTSAAAGLLITNGCIRYILTTDKTKGKKVLYIILTFIPIFNVVYGVICLKRISKKV